MKILFSVFGFPIYFFGVMIALGLIAGIIPIAIPLALSINSSIPLKYYWLS